MLYQQDWMMKQIQNIVQIITRFFFKKDTIAYEITNNEANAETDLLYKQLLELLSSFKINEAENLLFESIKADDLNYLKIAVDFYNRLNTLSNEQLEKHDFSRGEIKSGLEEISKIFGLML